MRSLVVYTAVAGSGGAATRAAAVAERLGAELLGADQPGQAERLTADHGPVDVVVAAGGDGTVHEVACGLLQRSDRPILGLAPIGTGNDIARNLGLRSVEDGLAAIEAGHTRPLDVLAIELETPDGRRTTHSVLNCGIGFSALVVRATTPTVKRLCGPSWAYVVGTLRALRRWRSPVYRVRWDDGERRERLLWLGLGNGEYEGGGSMRLSPGARMDDGRLELLLVRDGPKLEVLRNLPKLAAGTHLGHRLVEYRSVTRLEVTCEDGPFDGQVEIQADGDVIGRTPCSIALLPGALRVLAP